MFVRTLIAAATLGGGIVLGNWFFSYPSHAPFASTDGAPVAAAKPRPNREAPAIAVVGQPEWQPTAATVEQAPVAKPAAPEVHRAMPAVPVLDAQRLLTRDLQSELVRLGCYQGPIDGHWSVKLQGALGEFAARLNTTLPVTQPDVAFLSLAKAQVSPVCGAEGYASGTQADAGQESGGLVSEPDVQPMSEAMGGGRMSLGGTPEGSAPSPAIPSRRRALTREQKLFIHPLGQL